MIAQTEAAESVYYAVEGAGDPLLLLHGAACNADFMAPLAAELSDQFRCISLDRLGYRRSSRLEHDTTIEQQVRGVRAVHRASSKKPAWVFGHSSGGNFALAYALRFPSAVKGLVLFEPALYALHPSDSRPPALDVMEDEILPIFGRGDVEKGFELFAELLEFEPSTLEEFSHLPFADQTADNNAAFAHDQPVVIRWGPSDRELSELAAPVLLMEGDLTTRLLRDIVHILATKVPGAQVVSLKGRDHAAPLLQPSEVARTVKSFVSG